MDEVPVKIRWHKEARYFEVHLTRDLFGQCVVTRVWGRRNSALGQVRHSAVDNYQAGLGLIDKIAKQRHQRGYVQIEEQR